MGILKFQIAVGSCSKTLAGPTYDESNPLILITLNELALIIYPQSTLIKDPHIAILQPNP